MLHTVTLNTRFSIGYSEKYTSLEQDVCLRVFFLINELAIHIRRQFH